MHQAEQKALGESGQAVAQDEKAPKEEKPVIDLPAKEEIALITLKEREAINRTLLSAGGKTLPELNEPGRYWSSTEYDAASVWHVYMRYGLEYYTVKYLTYRVRAVAKF